MDKLKVKELVNVISNFRNGELNFGIDEAHILKWLAQFSDDNKNIIFEETLYVLKKWYFNREDFYNFLETIIKYLCKKNSVKEQELFRKVVFTSEQIDGLSQKRLLDMLYRMIEERYGISISRFITLECCSYVYIDDGLYTGKRARKDIIDLIYLLPKGSSLDVFYMIAGMQGLKYTEKQISTAANECNIKVELFRMHPIENIKNVESWSESDGTYVECYSKEQTCLWPDSSLSLIREIKEFEEYYKKLSPNFEKKPYRSGHWINNKGVFSSVKSRNIVEREFLLKGIEIIKSCDSTKGMYPLGYNLWPSFGFGSFTANDMNISNTCPLILWWGNNLKLGNALDAWYPLLPRRVNHQESFDCDEEAEEYEVSYRKSDQYNMCPDCGKYFGIEDDGGNGFCTDCAWKH